MAQKCKYCGEELEDRAKFCTSCGKSTTGAEKLELDEEDNDEVLDEFDEIEDEEYDDTVINSLSEAPRPKAPSRYDDTEMETAPVVVVPTESNKNDFIVDHPSALQQMPEIQPERPAQVEQVEEELVVPDDGQYHPVISKNEAKRDPNKGKGKSLRIVVIVASILAVIALIFGGITLFKGIMESKKTDDGIPKTIGQMEAKRVGNEQYGKTAEGGQSLQYTDGTGWIATIYATSMQQTTPTVYSETVVKNMNQMGAENVKIEKTTLNGFEGFVISGYYRNVNVYITAWILDGKDSKSHYISVEGPGPLTDDNSYNEIPKSFRTDK